MDQGSIEERDQANKDPNVINRSFAYHDRFRQMKKHMTDVEIYEYALCKGFDEELDEWMTVQFNT